MLNKWKECKEALGLVGTGSVLCSGWQYWYLQPELPRWYCWQRGHLPFYPSHPAKQCYVWAALLQKRETNNHPTTAGASLRLIHVAAVAMAAVITLGGCSGGPPPPRLLFPLPQEHQAALMKALVAGSLTAFPGEHLVSPPPGLSTVVQLFCWPLAAPCNSSAMGCSYRTRCSYFPTSWYSLVHVIAKHVLVLSMYKSILQSDSISLTLSAAENKFSIPLHMTMLKSACLCPFLCLHQTVGDSKGCTLNSPSSSWRPQWLFPLWSAKLYYWIWEPWQLSNTNRHIQEMFWWSLVCRIQSTWDGWILWTGQPMPCLMLSNANQSMFRLFLQFSSNFSHF